MGMPVTVQIAEGNATEEDIQEVFAYLNYIDQKFSTYKKDSEISRINRGEINNADYSKELKMILKLSEQTKKETAGYFDINLNGILDPSGIVIGYAFYQS